jgi:hypothetical protein
VSDRRSRPARSAALPPVEGSDRGASATLGWSAPSAVRPASGGRLAPVLLRSESARIHLTEAPDGTTMGLVFGVSAR